MEFKELVHRAMTLRKLYAELEEKRYGRSWSDEEIALGFVGDVGDLMKLVMAQNGVRDISGAKEKLAHELADCLWSVLVLAQRYDIDLENIFFETMDELEKHIISTSKY